MNKKIIISFIFVSFLSACASAPGHKFNPPPEDSNIDVQPITAQLILEQKNDNVEMPTHNSKTITQLIEDYEYKIGPHDVLDIIVWDHPELSVSAGENRTTLEAGHLVTETGTIFFPYVGEIMVEGKTMSQVREILTKELSTLVRNPQVTVNVIAFRSKNYYVTGEVETPGSFAITDKPVTLVDAVTNAGRYKENADMSNVILTHGNVAQKINMLRILHDGDLTNNTILSAGDVLHIPSLDEQKIFVIGEVEEPQSMFIRDGSMSLAEAISDAGGVDRITSNPGQIYVIRGELDAPKVYHLNAKSPDALLLGEKFRLHARDIVYVDSAAVTRWNRVIEQILPSSAVIRDASTL